MSTLRLLPMKRITFSGGSIVTSNAIAEAILEYTTSVADAENSVTVDITVLESNGHTSIHTLLLSPASQFDVTDVGGLMADDEQEQFPLPDMPQVGILGKVDKAGHPRAATSQFEKMMKQIDDGSQV